MVPLSWYLILAALLFSMGLYGVMARRNMVTMLMSLELMLNGIILNLIAFGHYLEHRGINGEVFALFIYMLAACETVLGLGLTVLVWRYRKSVQVDNLDILKG